MQIITEKIDELYKILLARRTELDKERELNAMERRQNKEQSADLNAREKAVATLEAKHKKIASLLDLQEELKRLGAEISSENQVLARAKAAHEVRVTAWEKEKSDKEDEIKARNIKIDKKFKELEEKAAGYKKEVLASISRELSRKGIKIDVNDK